MNGKKWASLDFNVASDYTHGTPEYYRTLLRQMVGIPSFLPGEKPVDIHKTAGHGKTDPSEILIRGNVSRNIHKGKR
jgi:hypothetical protein